MFVKKIVSRREITNLNVNHDHFSHSVAENRTNVGGSVREGRVFSMFNIFVNLSVQLMGRCSSWVVSTVWLSV